MEITQLLNKAKQVMEKSYQHAESAFATFRVHRVEAAMIKEIRIDHYGVPTPLYQLAMIMVENAMTLSVKPWDKKLLLEIMKVLSKQEQNSFTLVQKEDRIELHRRPLTEEGRKEMVKQLGNKAEEARVAIRNARKPIKQEAKYMTDEDAVKVLETKLQELTQEYIEKVDNLYKEKEAEIMKV